MSLFAVILLVLNTVLVASIIIVLMSMRAQSKRIAQMAEEAHDLAERAERHIDEARAAGEAGGADAPPDVTKADGGPENT